MIKSKTLKFFQFASVALIFIWMASCDDSFSEIGSDIVGGVNFDINRFTETEISAFNVKLNPVQSNNFPAYLLGVMNDPVYGSFNANVASEVFLTQLNPSFGLNATIDSVILSIPYFVTQIGFDTITSQRVFRIDSLFGSDPFKLTIYENNFFLNSLDPDNNFQSTIPLFSDRHESFINLVGPVLYQNDNFFPSNENIPIFPNTGNLETDTIPESIQPPALRVSLDKDFFKQKLLDKEGSVELSNINNFQNFFRGLYFVAEPVNPNSKGAVLLDMDQGVIEVRFSLDVEDTADQDEDGDVTELIRSRQSINITLNGSQANTHVQQFDSDILQQITAADTVLGDEKLFLKGGGGSMAVIKLFGPDNDGDGEADQLTQLKQTDRLVNNAELIFDIDTDAMSNSIEPTRIYIYDLKNNIPLVDFNNDLVTVSQNIFLTRTIYDGLIQRDANKKGIRYRVRLTDHIRNILRRDSLNVPLGLVITNDVTTLGNSIIKNAEELPVKEIPRFSAYNPFGTVLYGSKPIPGKEDKRARLVITFTEDVRQ